MEFINDLDPVTCPECGRTSQPIEDSDDDKSPICGHCGHAYNEQELVKLQWDDEHDR